MTQQELWNLALLAIATILGAGTPVRVDAAGRTSGDAIDWSAPPPAVPAWVVELARGRPLPHSALFAQMAGLRMSSRMRASLPGGDVTPDFTLTNREDRSQVVHFGGLQKYTYFSTPPKTWSPATVNWKYNPAGQPAGFSQANVVATLQAATAHWEAVCNIHFVYQGTTSAPNTDNCDAENVVGWGPLAGSTVGYAGACWSGSFFIGMDITLDNDVGGISTLTLLEQVATHEFGHTLGLGHTSVSPSVMTASVSTGTPSADDIAGCVSLYGTPTGSTTPTASLSTGSLAFGTVTVGVSSAAQSVRVTNTGAGTLSLTNLQITGTNAGEFNRTGTCSIGTSLGAGQFCDATLTFSPAGTGARTATLSITSNAAGSPHAVGLSGSGTAPSDTTPDAFSFAPRSGLAPATKPTAAFTVSGITAASPISVAGGAYSINGGAYTTAAGSVTNGQQVTLRANAPLAYRSAAAATLSIGGVGASLQANTGGPRSEVSSNANSDLLWFNTGSGTLLAWFGSASGYSGSTTLGSTGAGTGWTPLALGDFNGDGNTDIAWLHTSGAVNIWLLSGGAVVPSSGYVQSVGAGWTLLGVADFNGDGRTDLLWYNSSTGALLVWYISGASLAGSASLPTQPPASGWLPVGLADVNGDGQKDVVWRHSSSGAVNVWLMQGTTVLPQSGLVSYAGSSWSFVGTGDFDGDGSEDLVWRHTSGAINVWFMNGTSYLGTSGQIATVGAGWSVASIADFNGDGKADFIWRSSAGDNLMWQMSGASLIASPSLPAVSPGSGWTLIPGR